MTGRIEIDPDALERASGDLSDAGRRLTGSASSAGSVAISSRAFGEMNSYLGDSIAIAARHTVDLLRLVGGVTSALGVSAQEAADEWTVYEENVSSALTAAEADLNAAQEIL